MNKTTLSILIAVCLILSVSATRLTKNSGKVLKRYWNPNNQTNTSCWFANPSEFPYGAAPRHSNGTQNYCPLNMAFQFYNNACQFSECCFGCLDCRSYVPGQEACYDNYSDVPTNRSTYNYYNSTNSTNYTQPTYPLYPNQTNNTNNTCIYANPNDYNYTLPPRPVNGSGYCPIDMAYRLSDRSCLRTQCCVQTKCVDCRTYYPGQSWCYGN